MSWFQPTTLVTTSSLFVRPVIFSIINELGINSTLGNRTYTPTTFPKIYASVLNILNIPGHVDNDYELPYLYWIPKPHKTPYKERYIAG
jgi:hypothetical protein